MSERGWRPLRPLEDPSEHKEIRMGPDGQAEVPVGLVPFNPLSAFLHTAEERGWTIILKPPKREPK